MRLPWSRKPAPEVRITRDLYVTLEFRGTEAWPAELALMVMGLVAASDCPEIPLVRAGYICGSEHRGEM